MSNRINNLYKEKQNTWNEAKLLNDACADGVMSAEDSAKYDKYIARVKEIDAQIEQEREYERLRAENAKPVEGGKTVEEAKKENTDLIDKWMRSPRSLTEEERKKVNLGQDDAGRPYMDLRTVNQSTTTTAGGYTIDTTLAGYIETAKKYYGGMFEAPTWIRTSKGETMYFPTVNDTGNTGAKETEGADMFSSSTSITFGRSQLDAYIYSSEGITVSNQMLRDSEFNLAQFVGERLGERLYRKVNTDLTTANGSSTINGIENAASHGEHAANNTITRDDIVNLIYSVDRAYRIGPKAGFMFHDSTEKAIMKLSVGSTDDRPLWTPSMRDGAPDKIEGFQYWINNDMDELTSGSSSKSVFFGDWSKYICREVVPLRIVRLVERYAELDAVGFIVIGHYDGDLIAASSSYPIKYIRQYAT